MTPRSRRTRAVVAAPVPGDVRDPGEVVHAGDFLHVAEPAPQLERPVVVSIPHFGGASLAAGHVAAEPVPDFAPEMGKHLAFGCSDAYAAELYGDLHDAGARVIATRLSRLFVDVNRPRHDFEAADDGVRSHNGVVRTHTRRRRPIFTSSPSRDAVETRLAAFYDPYYAAVDAQLAACAKRHRKVLLLDTHTASPRRMGEHQVVLGTRRGRTADPAVAEALGEVFETAGFAVHHNVPGYVGANIVRTFGRHRRAGVHAVQIEVNAGLLQTIDYQGFIDAQLAGRRPAPDGAVLSKLRSCMAEAVRLGRILLAATP